MLPGMTASNAVPGFVPSVHGLHFANRFEPGPTISLGPLDPRIVGVGDASAGLCGGMVWFVRERFTGGLPIPAGTIAPTNGSPLFRALVRRQVMSLGWLRVPLRFWFAAAMPPDALVLRSLEREWPQIRTAIDAGHLARIGLVRHHGVSPFGLARDHQVLAFGYEVEDGPGGPEVTLRVYDPNWPGRDDVTVTLSPAGMGQSTGERLLGVIAL
jgi:hypothetical protein